MQFIEQPTTITIKNCDIQTPENIKFHRHGTLLPSHIRSIVCGPSSCGKTNVVISLLEDPNGVRFKNVYLYSMSLHQPKYLYLRNIFSFQYCLLNFNKKYSNIISYSTITAT